MPNLQMNLLENSRSFLTEALSAALRAEREPTHWKFAILFLVQAIELSLKERLGRENPVLIYADIDKPKNTVSLKQALERLTAIAKVEIKDSDRGSIHAAIEWRDRVVHFKFQFDTQTVKVVFASLLGFFTDFTQRELGEDAYMYLPKEILNEALSVKAYANELLDRVAERIEKEGIEDKNVWDCPSCRDSTFVIQSPVYRCYMCGCHDRIAECNDCGHVDFVWNMYRIYTGDFTERSSQLICDECTSEYDDSQVFDSDTKWPMK